ncbi:amphi-Trp domain-containing protein [Lentibacillus saliphilus]|uniref:amphi-Trp domain-containing protein n=1 Tax=Lentibacillus saliphilus TaxID=2737028 RepID=UPI001C2FB14B|nr:amphi-Trp domain-containing protein [Lentibacillus saliphilus]
MTTRKPKVVHVDYEEKMSLDHAVQFLESIVTKLKDEKSFTLTHGGKAHHIAPSSQVELEVKVEEQNGKHKLELELEWLEGAENKWLHIE